MPERYRLPCPAWWQSTRNSDSGAGRSCEMPGMMVVVTDQDTGNETTEQTSDGRPPRVADGVEGALSEQQPATRPPIDKTLVIVLLLVGLGIALVGRGLLVGITGDERANLPDLIERVDPVPESVQVPSQSNVFVDLAAGYTGVLVIDGLEIETISIDQLRRPEIKPGEQIDLPAVTIFDPGNSTLTFSPSSNAAISEFSEGQHSARLIYWKVEDGRQRARSFTWTFNVV